MQKNVFICEMKLYFWNQKIVINGSPCICINVNPHHIHKLVEQLVALFNFFLRLLQILLKL